MLKKSIFLFLVILASCSNPPETKEVAVSPRNKAKPKSQPVKPASNPWKINSFAPKEGSTEGKKYVRYVCEGTFSDSIKSDNYLYAEVFVDKNSAGIFLHELKKSNPAEKFSEPVQIRLTNSAGDELQMTSSRRWNSTGGILIEKNNNDYSQFRIYLLQNKGTLAVEIRNSGNTRIYQFSINADGFGESFASI